MKHCSNNKADRSLGEYWERQFCAMAAQHGFAFTPMQIGRSTSAQAYGQTGKEWYCYTLPDVTVWTAPGQHHEIKHKDPTWDGCFGLEKYRLESLLWFADQTRQQVMYTIHNHSLSGGRDNRNNNLQHWVTADVRSLDRAWLREKMGDSWVNGEKKPVPIYYWGAKMWTPLAEYWRQLCCYQQSSSHQQH